MLLALLSLLRKHFDISLCVMAATVVGGIVFYEQVELHLMKTKLGRCQAETAGLQMSNRHLLNSIELQNDAIADLGRKSVAQRKKELAIMRQSKKDSTLAARKASAIMRRRFEGSSCQSLHRLLKEYVPSPEK